MNTKQGAPLEIIADQSNQIAILGLLRTIPRPGLAILWRSFQYSRDLKGASGDFAVSCHELAECGFTANDIRWLEFRGITTSATQFSQPIPQALSYRGGSRAEAITLTEFGSNIVGLLLNGNSGEQESQPTPVAQQSPIRRLKQNPLPRWDSQRRELRFDQVVLKLFRWPAVNQETLLMAFEEEGWPARIDDPLSPQQEQDPKRRLHDTIKCLNRNHLHKIIHFRGDGTGEGVIWDLLGSPNRDDS
jgi:hypothetical protein